MKTAEELMSLAVKAREHAYAPYSSYMVGAALEAASGIVYTGCNVENRSYGLTICAERNAVAAAVCAGERDFVQLAVAGTGEVIAYPCGACLQVLAEFSPRLTIFSGTGEGRYEKNTLDQLLTKVFGL